MKNKFSKKYKNVLIIKGTQGMAKLSLAVVSGSGAVRRSAQELFVCASETINPISVPHHTQPFGSDARTAAPDSLFTSSFVATATPTKVSNQSVTTVRTSSGQMSGCAEVLPVGGRLGSTPRARMLNRAGRQLSFKASKNSEAIVSLNPRARRSGLLWSQLAVFAATLVIPVLVALLPSGVASRLPFAPEQASAATSNQLNFQGRLLTAGGALVPDGIYNMEFNLYSVSSGGSTLWTEDRLVTNTQGVSVQNGYYSVYLGEYDAFPVIDWSQDLYLGMTIRGTASCAWGACTPADSEMTPRFKLTAVPYAFRASNVASSSTNAASSNSDAVSITTGNALGATSNSGNITVDVGTATGTTGTISLGSSNASALTIGRAGITTTLQGTVSLTGAGTALNVTNSADIGGALTVDGNVTLGTNTTNTLTVEADATFNGSLTVATGDQFTNAGSSLFTAVAISDVAGGGNIGSAATTVDVATTFNINQTTAAQTLTLPNPTDATSGRIVYVNNVGSASFTMYGSVIATNRSNAFIWNGSAWVTTVSLSGSVVNTVGTIDSQTKSADGAVISSNAIYLQTADASFAGLVSTSTQTFAGAKTFNGLITAAAGLTVSSGQNLTLAGVTSCVGLKTNGSGVVACGANENTYVVAASDSVNAATANYVADGTADEAEIESAITAANAAGGGTVLLLEGTYNITTSIDLNDDVELVGAGQDSTILFVPNSTNSAFPVILVSGDDNVRLAGFTIDGNNAGNTTDNTDGVQIAASSAYTTIDNVRSRNNGEDGFDFGSSVRGKVINSISRDNLSRGVYVNSNDILIENNYIPANGNGSGADGGVYSLGDKTRIIGNHFNSNNPSAASATILLSGRNGIVSNNFMENSVSGPDIYLSGDDTSVTGNTINNSVDNAIEVESTANGTVVSGNAIYDAGVTGIYANGSLTTVTGNTIEVAGDDGIYVGANQITAIGNTINTPADMGIYVSGANYSTISDNGIYAPGDDGISLGTALNNTVSGNSIRLGADIGVLVDASSHNNIISSNQFYDNGGATAADAIDIDGDNNKVMGNHMYDAAGTSDFISTAAGADSTYLSSNTFEAGSVIALKINDAGTNTIFAGQLTVATVLRNDSSEFTSNRTVTLTGTIDPIASTTVTGVGTAFTTELAVGDRIIVSGETRTVVAVASTTSLTVDTAFTDNANDTTPDKLSAALRVRDSSGNVDLAVTENGAIYVPNLTSCTALETNASGLISCGSDADSGATLTLDGAYNNFGATPSKITVDAAEGQTGGLEFESTGANNIFVDLQGTGDFIVQDAGAAVFTVDDSGNTTLTGILAVNGDTITGDSNLTINATGYTRIGDTGTPTVANGDDDLYVEGDLETDGTLVLGANTTTSAWGLNGVQLQAGAATYTDSSTAGAGTATNAVFNSFATPTLAATNSSVTTTNAATVYIQGAPTAGTNQTITNPYAFWVDGGLTRLDGNLVIGDAEMGNAGFLAEFQGTTTASISVTAGDASSSSVIYLGTEGNETGQGALAYDNNTDIYYITANGGSGTITLDANSTFTVGTAAATGELRLADGSSNYVTFNVNALAGDYTLSVPTITANDTLCLLTLGNCAGAGREFTAVVGRSGGTNPSTNVSAAGYIADGTSDEDEINSAITAVNTAGGGKVLLLEGTYFIDGTIDIKSDVELVGSGQGATIIQIIDGHNANLIAISESTDPNNFVIRDLTIDANDDGNTGNQGGITLFGTGSNSGATSAHGGVIQNIEIKDTSDNGIYLDDSDFVTIADNHIYDGTTYGMWIESGDVDRGIIVRNNNVHDMGNGGISVQNSEGVVVSGNTTNNNGGYGIEVDSTDGGTITGNTANNNVDGIVTYGGQLTITGNSTFGNSGAGISVNEAGWTTVSGNVVGGTTGTAAIELNELYYSNVSDNTIYNSTNEGILMTGAAGNTQNSIVGNKISATTGKAIQLNSLATDTTIQNNNIDVVGEDGIDTNGADETLISDNSITTVGTSVGASSSILVSGDSNNSTIVGNKIRDAAGTGYAIDIEAAADNTYLADNTYGGTGATSNRDLGTNTIFGNQIDSSGNIELQAGDSGVLQLLSNTDITGTLTVSGLIVAGATGSNGTATGAGDLYVQDTLEIDGNLVIGSANTDTISINAGSSGSGITFEDDTFNSCVLTTSAAGVLTCATSGSLVTLQQAYVGGNTISATDAEGSIGFTLTEATNFTTNLNGTGDFVVQDGGNAVLTVDDSGLVTLKKNTSAGQILQITDESSVSVLTINTTTSGSSDNSLVFDGVGIFGNGAVDVGYADSSIRIGNHFYNDNDWDGGTGSESGYSFLPENNDFTSAGTSSSLTVTQLVDPTSGTRNVNNLLLNNTINQTGGASGITRGLSISPTLTAFADYRGLEVATTSSYTTANNQQGSQLTVTDTGIVTSGTDTTTGQAITLTRTGATGGTINTTGQSISLTTDNAGGSGTHTATGLSVTLDGNADFNYAALFSGGNVGIGDVTPAALLTVGASDAFQVDNSGNITAAGTLNVTGTGASSIAGPTTFGASGNYGIVTLQMQSADNFASGLRVQKRGAAGDINAAVASGAELGYHEFYGWNGSAYVRGAYAIARSTEAFTGSANGSAYAIATTPNGGTSAVERLTVGQDGNVTLTNDLAVNGDDITSDGALTVNAATYVRIGDTGTPGVYSGDDDLYVEGDLEVDGNFNIAGDTITLANGAFTTCTALETVAGVLTCGSDAGGTPTLQNAYEGGNTILAVDAEGDIDLTVSEATNFSVDVTGTGSFLVQDGGVNILSINSSGNTTFNPTGGNYDFSIQGDNDADLFEVDASTDRIGIGDATPAALLTVGSGDLFQVNTSGDVTTAAGENLSVTTGTTGTLTLDTGTTGAISLGTGANAKTITIGNTTGATALNLLTGTGNFSLDGVAGTTYTLGASTTTGTIAIGGTAQTGNITLGSSSGTNSVLIGNGAGATTVNIANANTAGAVNIGSAFTTGTISIGGTGAQTGTIDLGVGTGAQAINLGTGGTGAKTLTVGSTASTGVTTIQAGTGGVLVKPANGTTAFQVQNASSASLFAVDTTNGGNITLLGNTGSNSNGEMGAWAANTALGTARDNAQAAYANGYIYVPAGETGAALHSTVAYAKVGADGTLGAWSTTGTSMPQRDYAASATANGYIYIMGGTTAFANNDVSATVNYAKINADGTVGTFAATSSLPGARKRGQAIAMNGYMYFVGGDSSSTATPTVVDDIYYAKINADGTLGTWASVTNATAGLPAVRHTVSVATANGFLYVIGGSSSTATAEEEVYYVRPTATGDITSAFTSDADTLPAARFGGGAYVANGYIYYAGGVASSVYRPEVYYAPLALDGSVGTWSTQNTANDFPAGKATFSYVQANGYFYAIGGYDGSSALTTVYSASVPRVRVGGHLDLVGLGGENLYDPAGSGSLTAGDTQIIGMLQVQGPAAFNGDLSVNGNITGALNLALGTPAQAGTILLSDGSSSTITFKTATQAAATNYDLTVPAITANDTFCLVTLANCAGAGREFTAVVGTSVDSSNVSAAGYVADGDAGGAGNGDQIEINSAITAVNAAGGGTVYLLEGTYTIDATITLLDNVKIIGAGQDATVIQLRNSHNSTVGLFTASSGVEDWEIRDLSINGNHANQTSGTYYGVTATSTGDFDNKGGSINNVEFYNLEDTNSVGVTMDTVENLTITNSHFHDVYNGVYALASGTSVNLNISGSKFSGITNTGVTLQNIVEVTIEGNTFNDSSGTAFISLNSAAAVAISSNAFGGYDSMPGIVGQNTGVTEIAISGNSFEQHTGSGVQGIFSNSLITGNSFNEVGNDQATNYQAIRVTSTTNTTISGNSIYSPTGDGIQLDSASGSNLYNTITGNTIEGADNGIMLETGSDYNVISSNTIFDNNNVGISLNVSDNNIISNNIVHDNGNNGADDGIALVGDSNDNQLIGNRITDTGSGTGQAIDISATSDNTYLADNTYSGTGAATITDAGTATVYANQYSSATNLAVSTANTHTINIGGAAQTGTITLGSSSGTQSVLIGNGAGASTVSIANATVAGATVNIAGGANTSASTISIANGATAAATTVSILSGVGTASTATLNLGNNTRVTQIDIGNIAAAAARTINLGTGSNTVGIDTINIGTGNTTVAGGKTINIGNGTPSGSGSNLVSIGSTALASSTVLQGGTAGISFNISGTQQAIFAGSNTLYLGNASTSGTAASPNAFTVQGTGSSTAATAGGAVNLVAGTGNTSGAGGALTVRAGTGGTSGVGGVLTLQGGTAGGGATNGGNVALVGGVGSGAGVKGLVIADTFALSTAGAQNCTSTPCAITQANVDSYGAVLITTNASGYEVTLGDPTLGASATGRLIYITNADATDDFVLSANGGAEEINLKPNTTATMIWNGSDWTAAGASSSTDLQAAYDNTAASAGGAEIVLASAGTGGLTIRNDATTAIVGGLLEVQTSIGSNLFTVNNNATEYADNGGAESSTFTMWTAAPAGGTITRYTTPGDNIATGAASVFVDTTSTANTGVQNTLTTTLTPNLKYRVSYAVRHTSSTVGFSTLDTVFSRDGTNTSTTACATASTATYGQWTRISCTFTAPSSGITASNAIFIRHSDAVEHDFYIDNLSVNVSADVNHAADGDVDAALGTNWTAFGAGSAVSLENSIIYNTSGSVQVDTTNNTDRGVTNNLSITPSVSTQYLVSFYARLDSGTFNDIRVRYSRDGGTDFETCTDYNTQAVSTTSFTKITCLFTTDGTTATDPDLIIDQPTAPGATRIFYIDALSVTLNTNNASNVQIGGGNKGGPATLFTLDRSAGNPIADNNDAYLGSMYYDTESGRIQCYEADGWGACGAAPDNVVNLNPEYAGAVLNGTGVGTMTADFCSNDTDLLVNDALCDNGDASIQAKNFYQWTSPQATEQTYSIYVTYQLPETFNGFASDDTVQLIARVDDTTNASVTYEMYKSTGTDVTQCGTGETDIIAGNSGVQDVWYSYGISGNEATGCSFTSSSAGNFIIFKINMKANSNANAYVSTLSFTTTGR